MTNVSPYECVPKHEGEAKCPECGENHKEYGILPEETLILDEIEDLLGYDSIDGIAPVCTVHGEDKNGLYAKVVPQLVLREGTTLRLLWNDPTDETEKWVMLEQIEVDVEEEVEAKEWMQSWASDLHIIAQAMQTIGEYEIVESDVGEELDRINYYYNQEESEV